MSGVPSASVIVNDSSSPFGFGVFVAMKIDERSQKRRKTVMNESRVAHPDAMRSCRLRGAAGAGAFDTTAHRTAVVPRSARAPRVGKGATRGAGAARRGRGPGAAE